MVAYLPEDGFAPSDTNFDDQSAPLRTWTDRSQLSSTASPATPSLSGTTSNDSSSHVSSCSTVVGTELVELPGCQL